MPRFVIAPDSFKESLTAMQACHATRYMLGHAAG